jgi:two-component system chemotaxis response regulator CheB
MNRFKCVIFGISTGGPETLQKIIPLFPKDFNIPIVIVQHMKPFFTNQLARRLNEISEIEVKEAKNNEILKKNCIYIAPGDYHLVIKPFRQNELIAVLVDSAPVNSCKPSVDVTFLSAVKYLKSEVLAIIMTGMGNDGYEGIKELKKSFKSVVIAQNKESCVVFGMPKKVVEEKLADYVIHYKDIVDKIKEICLYRKSYFN